MSGALAWVRLLGWGGAVPSGVASSRGGWSERRGVLLVLGDGAGRVGLGEATPLPGYSPDTVADADAALGGLDWGAVAGLLAATPAEALLAALAGLGRALPPSAAFALETAALDLAAQRAGRPLGALLGPRGAPRAAVPRGTLAGRAGDPSARAQALADARRGARFIKLKADASDPPGLARWLTALRAELAPEVRLRLDLGGTLPVALAPAALAALARVPLDAVEEPTRPLGALHATAVPWLADESLLDGAERAALLANPACVGFVLKPTLLGGLGATLALAAAARAAGKALTVTHAFEGPVALAATAALAVAVEAQVAGVDPHAALAAFPVAAVEALDDIPPLVARPGRSPGLGLALRLPEGGRVAWPR